MKMTVKDLVRVYNSHDHFKRGYCCYQDDNISKWDLLELGFNHGVYGWNWTCYLDVKTDTIYVSCYRNVPNYLTEK